MLWSKKKAINEGNKNFFLVKMFRKSFLSFPLHQLQNYSYRSIDAAFLFLLIVIFYVD
jgi:ABC-type transport system involved in cytochrome c biogenesis permease subunit